MAKIFSTIKQIFEIGYLVLPTQTAVVCCQTDFMLRGKVFRMIKMNAYLKQVKALADKRTDILAVLGNESVDLDSAGE
jgi:hypothetical protein